MDDQKLTGTFLICPDCSRGGRDTLNIEMSGLIYEITNAEKDVNWSSKLQSGTKVILPPGTEITVDSKIDLKGGKPRELVEQH
jgi:hypothetical protein